MKYMIGIFTITIFCTANASLHDELNYSSASAAARKGKWEQAEKKMTSVLIDNPGRADLLYDLGVSSYRLKKFDNAAAYFQEAAAKATDESLKEQAHFNLGNTYVAQKKLKEAIKEYENVLALDPSHEKARHNLEIVKKMLEQEQKKEKQDKNQDKKQQEKDNKQDKKDDKKDSSDKDEQSDKGKDTQKDKSDQQDQRDSAGDQDQEDASADGDERNDHGQDGNRGSQGNQRDNKGNPKNDADDGDDDDRYENGKKDQASNQKSQQQRGDQKRNKTQNHDNSPSHNDGLASSNTTPPHHTQDENDSQEKEEKAHGFAQSNAKDQFAADEQWMAHLLQVQENADKNANKRLVRAHLHKNADQQPAKNCW